MDDDTQPGGEIWQVIPDTEGRYEVSDLGRVRSLVVGCQHGSIPRKQPLVMSPFNNKRGGSGYWVVNLRVGGRVKCRCVSELVLTAFVGPRPSPARRGARERRQERQPAGQPPVGHEEGERGAQATARHAPPAAAVHVIGGVDGGARRRWAM